MSDGRSFAVFRVVFWQEDQQVAAGETLSSLRSTGRANAPVPTCAYPPYSPPRPCIPDFALTENRMTVYCWLNTIIAMKLRVVFVGALLIMLALATSAMAQQDDENDEGPTASISFVVTKLDNGKAVRNAAVIMHAVNARGKQDKGDLELKTDPDGKASFDGLPYGKVRVQVLAQGFQTYGQDFDIGKPQVAIAIQLKRPQKQYSIYQDHPNDSSAAPKQDAPPSGASDKKPN